MLNSLVQYLLCAVALASLSGGTGALAQAAPPERTYMMSPAHVNLVDATFVMNFDEFSIGPLYFSRSYISSNPLSREYFGAGWTHSFDMFAYDRLAQGQNHVFVVIGRQTHHYAGTSSSNYPDNYDAGTKVTNVAGSIVFTDRDGTVYRFSPNGTNQPQTISSITYTNGTVVTVTNVSGKPKTIVSNLGYAIVLDYSGNYVSAACGFNLSVTYVSTSTTCAGATLKTSYGYTPVSGGSMLATVTDVSGNVTSYGYQTLGSSKLLNCVPNPGTSACKITNTYVAKTDMTAKIVVSSQVLADGSTWSYNCTCGQTALEDPDNFYPAPETTTMTEPNGSTTSTGFNIGSASLPATPSAVWFVDELGRYFPIDYSDRPGLVTMPEGNSYTWQYTWNGRVLSGRTIKAKTGTGLPDIALETRTFPTTGCTGSTFTSIECNLPLTATDANGNTTSYTYDSAHGGILTETKPADSNGIHPVVRNTYGQRYAWIKNAGGGFSQAGAPVWLLLETRTCRTSATLGNACSGGSADEVVTTFDYGPDAGPNNLLIRGIVVTATVPGAPSNPVGLRTCFGYDWQGNKAYETSPLANLGTCQ